MTRFITLLLLLSASATNAQSVMRIDSLPAQGVLLDKGWKWHAGDNPDWAKPDFDDATWGRINPTVFLSEIPQVRQAEIGWFRLTFYADSSIVAIPLMIASNPCGAIEVFLNNKRIQQVGIVSKNTNIERTHNSVLSTATDVFFLKKGANVISVRYSFTNPNIYWSSFLYTKTGSFSVTV